VHRSQRWGPRPPLLPNARTPCALISTRSSIRLSRSQINVTSFRLSDLAAVFALLHALQKLTPPRTGNPGACGTP
jgi:hypothetical protein